MSAFGNRVLTGESVLAQQDGRWREAQVSNVAQTDHWPSAK